ncbi:MAG: class I SAM-dependent RNA methyltransferase [Oscillospiraceae bacterium]|nr:class I SAM-dependent RNA methyltransferase [Oscillospiraceae bacterium]
MEFQAAAPCLFGLEKIVEFELKKTGARITAVENGRVFFSADEMQLAKANIWSRTAERILIVLKQFESADFDSLFEGVHSVHWGQYIERTDAFPVKGYSLGSKLSSVPAMQSVIKKAVAERLKKDHNSPFLTEKSGVTKQIRFSVVKDVCTLMLDTSGDGLHKRGYRPVVYGAPIRETLAAGIADFARIGPDSVVADPFCGSGTLLIEAAMRARNIAPGLNRSFAGEDYSFIGRRAYDEAKEEARASIQGDAAFFAVGSDVDASAIEAASKNAKTAGLGDIISFKTGDARVFKTEAGVTILANPPYGERLMSLSESEKLIEDFFDNLRGQNYKGLYIISSNHGFEALAKQRAARRRKLYNGMISCQLYMYY